MREDVTQHTFIIKISRLSYKLRDARSVPGLHENFSLFQKYAWWKKVFDECCIIRRHSAMRAGSTTDIETG